uniref:Uncharacterized protein n=1 Tax=Arundo donax TaxID=35708 RepID=A0A0A9C4G1_ARUDO
MLCSYAIVLMCKFHQAKPPFRKRTYEVQENENLMELIY